MKSQLNAVQQLYAECTSASAYYINAYGKASPFQAYVINAVGERKLLREIVPTNKEQFVAKGQFNVVLPCGIQLVRYTDVQALSRLLMPNLALASINGVPVLMPAKRRQVTMQQCVNDHELLRHNPKGYSALYALRYRVKNYLTLGKGIKKLEPFTYMVNAELTNAILWDVIKDVQYRSNEILCEIENLTNNHYFSLPSLQYRPHPRYFEDVNEVRTFPRGAYCTTRCFKADEDSSLAIKVACLNRHTALHYGFHYESQDERQTRYDIAEQKHQEFLGAGRTMQEVQDYLASKQYEDYCEAEFVRNTTQYGSVEIAQRKQASQAQLNEYTSLVQQQWDEYFDKYCLIEDVLESVTDSGIVDNLLEQLSTLENLMDLADKFIRFTDTSMDVSRAYAKLQRELQQEPVRLLDYITIVEAQYDKYFAEGNTAAAVLCSQYTRFTDSSMNYVRAFNELQEQLKQLK